MNNNIKIFNKSIVLIENISAKDFVVVVVVFYDHVVLRNVVHNDVDKEVLRMPNEIHVMLKHKQEN